MPRIKHATGFVLLAGLICWGALRALPLMGQDEKPTAPPAAEDDEKGRPTSTLSVFMRKKLQASSQILEGLTVEDLDIVVKGANTLNRISSAERWRIHNDVMYKQFSGEFQRMTRELIAAAEDDNLDKAALKWMDLTMSCIECHRYVRNNLVVVGE